MDNLGQVLERSINLYPDDVALICSGEQVTYAQLGERVAQFASYFSGLGLNKGDSVAIASFKSIDVVSVMQAALRVDLVYVSLDPRFPPERLKELIRDAAVSVVVLDEFLSQEWSKLEFLPDCIQYALTLHDEKKLEIKSDVKCHNFKEINSDSNDYKRFVPQRKGEDLAYLLYTSGSTGKPKGVRITHDNALAFVEWAASEFEFSQDEHFLNHAQLSFDLSVLDLYNAFLAGARVTLLPEDDAMFFSYVVNLIRDDQITNLYMVPSGIIGLMDKGALMKEAMPKLKRILFAGEKFPVTRLKALLDWVEPNQEVYNLYGPIETNVCTFSKIKTDIVFRSECPIGEAISNAQVALRQDNGIISYDGEGEIVVSGRCVSPGYLNSPILNKSKFFLQDNHRWYCTGDYGYFDKNKVLWLKGRKDNLIKIRGYRIELDEIESHVQDTELVDDVVAVFHGSNSESGAIVLWCVFNQQALDSYGSIDIVVNLIRQKLKSVLPHFMLPKLIKSVKELPKTNRGKVDRLKLKERGI